MAEVTLSDYAGYILRELVKAREMVDEYSRAVAQRRAQDPVMRFFPTARFRIPKMELTIPVLVTGARFTEKVRLRLSAQEWVSFVLARAAEVRSTVQLAHSTLHDDVHGGFHSPTVEQMANEFYGQLTANPDPRHPEAIVTCAWRRIFRTALAEAELIDFYEKYDPAHTLLAKTTEQTLIAIRQRTVLERTAIDCLLVDPETNTVKNGSNETSVFTIHAELQEEGFLIRSLRDEATGQAHPIVEFE